MNHSVTGRGGAVAPAITCAYDDAQAEAEGWAVFDSGVREDGTPRIEIQRIDSPEDGSEPSFTTDQAAWKHVTDRAKAGSALHRAALDLIDPVERMLIEAVFGWWPDTACNRTVPQRTAKEAMP